MTDYLESRRHRYDRLRQYAISYLSQSYSKPPVQRSLPDILQRIAMGELPHAGGVLRSLLGLPVAISPSIAGRIRVSSAAKPAHLPIINTPQPSGSLSAVIKPEPLAAAESSLTTPSPHISSSSALDAGAIAYGLEGEAVPAVNLRVGKKKKGKKKVSA